MARPRFERLPPARRTEILDTAAAAFAESGFDGASYNRILEASALPKSSAYYLFEGKADLYGAVLDREVRRLAEATPPPLAAADAASFWVELRRWLEGSLGFLARNLQSAQLLAGYVEARRSGLVDLDAELGAGMQGSVDELLSTGRAAGAVRTDVPAGLQAALAGAVLATLDHHFLPRLATGTPEEAAAAFDLYVDTLRRLLAP